MVEQGRYSPSLEVAFRIAQALHVRLDDVFQYPETPDPRPHNPANGPIDT